MSDDVDIKALLNVKALGLTLGIVWGSGMLLLGLMSLLWNCRTDVIKLIGSVYIGYTLTSWNIHWDHLGIL